MKSEFTVIKGGLGCDFLVKLPESRAGRPVRILQLTDPQIIDSYQRRTPDRIPADKIAAWAPENFDRQCGNQIRSLIAQTKPDLIFITGDVVYGEFDDNGTSILRITALMDSFGIPWAPVFGNHDNESRMGVDYQCGVFESAKHCLFKRGEVTGNGNYSVGIAVGDRLLRVIHMLDSNGCRNTTDPAVKREKGFGEDQLRLVEDNTARIRAAVGADVPAFMAFHIPHAVFHQAEVDKGYLTPDRFRYVIGVDTPAQDGDFGFKHCFCDTFETETDIFDLAAKNRIEALFIGHHHKTATVISYRGLKLVFGLKTGQYDSYVPGNLGGTLITLYGMEYEISHVSGCCPYGPVPPSESVFSDFFISQ